MPSYRYLFCDLLTDEKIAYLDLTGVQFGRRIIQPGTFRASLAITNPQIRDQAYKIRGGRTICHIYRDRDIWGSYIIWQARPAGDDAGRVTLQMQGATLESAFYRRKIRANLTYSNTDQLNIARALITHMQSRPEGDLGIQLSPTTSGVLRDRTYLASEAASYGLRLEQLAGVINGFEAMIRVYTDPFTGARIREWVPGYPQLGNPEAWHLITQRGNVLPWEYPDDATQSATSWQARGDTVQDDLSAQSEPLMSLVYEADDLLADGWPLWDETVDYGSVKLQATLDAHAELLRTTRSGNLRIPKVTVLLGDGATLNPNQLGDSARLILTNVWFPVTSDGAPTFDQRVRIVGMDITPPSRGTQETAALIFSGGE